MARIPDRARVFVTGGGSGLGRALAQQLAPRKARILIADVDTDSAQLAAQELRSLGAEVYVQRCDVGQAADVQAAAALMLERWGGTDVLINNAGVASGGTVGDLSLEDWQWIMNINLWGVIHGCHFFAPQMKAEGKGWILNVASSAGIATLPEMSSYNVTKAGVIALSETLKSELAPHNISVSVLCPTFVKTNLMKTFRSSDERQRKMANSFFARSTTTADEVAKAALSGLESGKLVIIPQMDGKLVWALKRLGHQTYYEQVARGYKSRLGRKALGL